MVHLYGEAGGVPAAGVGAVSSCSESRCTGTLRRQYQVMVDPLTPLHQQVGKSGIQRDVVIMGEEHLLRHQPHLDNEQQGEELSRAEGSDDEHGGLTGGRLTLW